MKFEDIKLPECLMEDMQNAPIPFQRAQNWAHAHTHPARKKDRIKYIKQRIQILLDRGASDSILEDKWQEIEEIQLESETHLFAK